MSSIKITNTVDSNMMNQYSNNLQGQDTILKVIRPSHLNMTMRRDPTRTTQLRNRFAANASRRFRELKTAIRISIVDNDCFGLKQDQHSRTRISALVKPTPVEPQKFAFARTSTKIEKFMDWLNIQEEKGILEIIRRPGALRGMEEAWTDVWIHSAYQKGILRARQELRKNDPGIPALAANDKMAITAAMNQPIHADRLGALYTRTFSELKGIDQAMDQQISRVLTEGLMEGKNPIAIAASLNDRVDKIGITRAKTMARTEIIRAHHVANINEYRQWGVDGVKVHVEWATAGWGVCPKCRPLQGKIFTLDEIEGKIPLHPNCRCCAIPVKV